VRTILEAVQDGTVAPTRILLLPPAYTTPEDFLHEGFVRAARERRLPVDLVFVELKLPHLADRTLLGRLRHEIVLPARALGCSSVWLGGISLGGFMAMAYAARFTQDIDGLCLLAPYLGNHMVVGEIERANGVDGWTPGDLAEDDDERRIWHFIKEQRNRSVTETQLRKSHEAQRRRRGAAEGIPRSAGGATRDNRTGPRPAPGLHLGFGSEDRFANSHRLMAAALPPDSVDVVSGQHEWPAWLRLWENFLDTRFPAGRA
jgi:pimeloyl-ACP methyl ester carboxylesterase